MSNRYELVTVTKDVNSDDSYIVEDRYGNEITFDVEELRDLYFKILKIILEDEKDND